MEIYDEITQKPAGIIEEIVVQNSAISQVYPLAINTVRVVTINDGKSVTPVFAFWRIGNNGKFVDNLNSGGMAAILNIEDGSITFLLLIKTEYSIQSIRTQICPLSDLKYLCGIRS